MFRFQKATYFSMHRPRFCAVEATVCPGLHATGTNANSPRRSTPFPEWRLSIWNNYRLLCVILLVAVASFIVYWPVIPGVTLMDDSRLVESDNPLVNGRLTPWTIWFQCDFPLSNVVFWLEHTAWGMNPLYYHVTNVVLHTISAVLLWSLLRKLRIRGASLAALVFAVHPVCVTSIARIAELKNALSLPVFLMSLLAYLMYENLALYPPPREAAESKNRWKGTVWYSISIAAFLLALFAKTSTIMLPVVFLLAAIWRRQRLQLSDFCHTLPHFTLAAAFGLMSAWFQKHQALAGQALPVSHFLDRVIIAGRAFWFYLGKIISPVHLTLSYPKWSVNPASVMAYAPILAVVITIFIAARYRRSWGRHLLFGLGCFATLLFPVLGFLDAQFMTMWQVSDHLQYLPMIAPVALACACIASIQFAAEGIAVCCVSFLIFTAHHRAYVFADEERLLRDTVAKNPTAWAAHNDLGCLEAKNQHYDRAHEHFSQSLRYNPGNTDAHVNLGRLLALQGREAEAEGHFGEALRLSPSNPEAHIQYAAILTKRGRHHHAVSHLRAAISVAESFDARMNLTALLYQTSDYSGAIRELQKVVTIYPRNAEGLNNLAWILATSPEKDVRDGSAAVGFATRACELTDYRLARTVGTLAAACAEAGLFEKAVENAGKAAALAEKSGDSRFAATNHQLARLYGSGRSFHEPSREITGGQ